MRILSVKSGDLTLDQMLERLAEQRNTAAGERVTAETALNSPTVYAIVNVVRRSLGQLPFEVIERDGESRHPIKDHWLAALLNRRPNGWQTGFQFKALIGVHLLLHGNFYAQKQRTAGGRVVNLVPLNPPAMSVEQLDSGLLSYGYAGANGQATLRQADVLHIRDLSTDGVMGTPFILRCREAIALEIAAERFGAAFFGSGALPAGIIEHPGAFRDDESRSRFKNTWDAMFGRKKRGTAVLEGGLKFTALQMANEDSQFLETRKLQREIIAGAAGIPPHMVGSLERATFSNIEQQSLEFVTYFLTPILANIEQQIVADLLTLEERDQLQGKFNVSALLRGDRKSRQEALHLMRQDGIINANEWRALEDMDPIPGPAGDTYLVPLNAGNAEQAGQSPPAESPPAESQSAVA